MHTQIGFGKLKLRSTAFIAAVVAVCGLLSPAWGQPGTRTAAHAFNNNLSVGNNFMASKSMNHQGAPEDYSLLQTSGFTHCRIGYKLDEVAGGSPDYLIPATEMQNLQNMVDWCIAEGLIANVDPVHNWCALETSGQFDPTRDLAKLQKIWEQVAAHFASYSTSQVCFEIINEPREDDDVAQIINTALPAIRGVAGNEQRMVIVPGDGFSTRQALIDALNADVIPVDDDYLIATFHYYDPKTFTKQGNGNITWGTGGINDADHDQVWIDFSAVEQANLAWAQRNNTDPLPIYLGEFGVDNGAPVSSREEWIEWVAQVAVDYGFSMAHWNMYKNTADSKGMGPWTTTEINDPTQRTFDSNIVTALMAGKTPSGIVRPTIVDTTEDVSAKQSQPDTNQGTANNLELRMDGASSFARVAYLKFNVLGLDNPVESAWLHIALNTESDPINVLAVSDNTWTETGLTWNNRPATGAVVGNGQGSAGTWVSVDLTSYITGDGIYSLALDEQGNSYHTVYARESGYGAYLEITEQDGGTGNNAPVFTSDPIAEVNATEGSAYGSTIADDATDADSDPLSFAKVSGPSWLSVASGGVLSGTPGSIDVGLNSWMVQVNDGNGGSDTATLEIIVDGLPGGPASDYANADIIGSGTVSGSYVNTQASDNSYEAISEVQSGGKPANRYSLLEHKWTINVTGGNSVTFYVEAYKTANSEGDDFVFAYSTDDANYTDMVTVSKTADDNAAQSFTLPNTLSGTVYIRVQDTDSTAGNLNLDTVYIDEMYILSDGEAPPNQAPSFTSNPIVEANAAEGAAYSSSIADNATDPESDPMSFSKVSGPTWLSVASDGSLSGTPGAGDAGLNTFTVQVDATGGSDTATLEITVDAAGSTPPGQASNPDPADGQQRVQNPILSWTAGADADSHDVYFGTTSGNLVFQGNQTGTTFDPGSLSGKTRYYWRIDEVNANGTTTGVEWWFKTK
jgi:hypothetical protein